MTNLLASETGIHLIVDHTAEYEYDAGEDGSVDNPVAGGFSTFLLILFWAENGLDVHSLCKTIHPIWEQNTVHEKSKNFLPIDLKLKHFS